MAVQPISGYTGPCILKITKTAIIVSLSSGDELATWLFNCIRQFNAVDCYFSFTSGRRGPFGVGEYCFELPQKRVLEIQKKISGHTGAVFAHNRNQNSDTLSASTNVSNPSQPKVPVTNDSSRYRSESETSPSAPLSSNLYPVTNPSKPMTYQNTGIARVIPPPLPNKDPVKTVTLHNTVPEAKYVNAMKGVPKPLPRTMKPSSMRPNGSKTYTDNSIVPPHTNGSVTLPSHSQRSQAVATSKPVLNPVGSLSDLNKGSPRCSSHVPNTNHRSLSPPTPPPATNSGYSEVDYDVIRRNREMGKFSDPDGAYSDDKDKKGQETYDVPSSLQVARDVYNVPRPIGGKFEDIPDVYEDNKKQPSPSDLYNVPTSNHRVTSPVRGQVVPQMCDVPLRQDQIYDNPSIPRITNGGPHDLYDIPQSNQPAVGGHETYDVVPSRKAYSSSPQPQMSPSNKKPPYENIGPNGEILGEIVADQLRQDLLDSLNGRDHHWPPRPLKEVNAKFSRSCDFLNGIGQESTKRFSSSSYYKRLIMPKEEIAQSGTLPESSWHTCKSHRRLSGSVGDIPTMEDNGDETYVVLNKTEKPNIKPSLPAAKNTHPPNANRIEDNDIGSNDMYIIMNRSPSHSSSSNTTADSDTSLPIGYMRMSTAKEALTFKKSNSSNDIGKKKETSPTNNEGRRRSDLVWPSNSGWSNWNPQDKQATRKSSDTSEVFSPPPAVPNDLPIVVSKPFARPKKSILLKGVSPQPVAVHEKRLGKNLSIDSVNFM